MAIKKFTTETLTLVGTVEGSWTPPVGAASVEVHADTAADVRMAFVEGGTADGEDYFVFQPDWWTDTSKPIDLRGEVTFYFRCAVGNVLRFLVGAE